MKLCTNCKHNRYSECLRSTKPRSCSKERRTPAAKAYFVNRCGTQGRFFEDKS